MSEAIIYSDSGGDSSGTNPVYEGDLIQSGPLTSPSIDPAATSADDDMISAAVAVGKVGKLIEVIMNGIAAFWEIGTWDGVTFTTIEVFDVAGRNPIPPYMPRNINKITCAAGEMFAARVLNQDVAASTYKVSFTWTEVTP